MDLTALLDDDVYKALKESFLHSGRGRPKNAPQDLPVTKRLLVQLFRLLKEGNKPPPTIDAWLSILCPDVAEVTVATTHFFNLVASADKELRTLSAESEIQAFLDQRVDLLHISPALSALGINKANITVPPQTPAVPLVEITNGVLIDMEQYRLCHSIKRTFILDWINKLGGIKLAAIPRMIDACMLTYRKLVKHRKKAGGEEELGTFLARIVTFKEKEQGTAVNVATCNCEAKLSKSNEVIKNIQCELQTMKTLFIEERKKCDDLTHRYEELKRTEKKLNDECESLKFRQAHLRTVYKDIKIKKNKSEKTAQAVFAKLQKARAEIKVKNQNFSRQENKKDEIIEDLTDKQSSLKSKYLSLLEENNQMKQELLQLRNEQEKNRELFDGQAIDLKTGENNTYSDDVRDTVIRLQSAGGVAATHVNDVIRIVSEGIFHCPIFDRLPCTQTAINMLNEGGVVSNLQTAEGILKSKNVTLHLDGTSRDHKKIVSHQVTLDNGETLYMGYTPVASEDASTLLEISINLLQKLSSAYSDLNSICSEETLRSILKKMTSTMSDRAAVMKSFGDKFKKYLESETGEQVQMHFLFCNAHFLLGMSSSCLKALEKAEKEIVLSTGEGLGRDKDKKFSRFQSDSETATNRIIRHACDLLGPRGDEKNGVRVQWAVFCSNSLIPSFKSNRFNCFFEAAAAIIHHLTQIKRFLSSGVLSEDVNLKIKSLAQDVEDDTLLCFLSAIALLYVHVTGPYWNVLNSSDVNYVDFHIYVQRLHECLNVWSTDVSQLLSPACSVFGENFNLKSPLVHSVFKFIETVDQGTLKLVINTVAPELLTVLERQLSDFLSGRYSQASDEETKDLLNHCPLTNLVGESSFGDLDYDINRRPNCSYFNRSSAHIVKRNKPMQFLSGKSHMQRSRIFSFARKQSRILKKQSSQQEADVSNRIKQKMTENQQKLIDKRVAEITTNADLLNKVKEHGGPCKTVNDVDRLFQNLVDQGKGKQVLSEFLKNELRFQKRLKNVKHLTLKGTIDDLKARLKLHFQSTQQEYNSEDLECTSSPKKLQRLN